MTIIYGKVIYMTDYCAKGTNCLIDLNSHHYVPGQQFMLKAVVLGEDNLNPLILGYSPEGNVETFFDLHGRVSSNTLTYSGSAISNLI